MGKPTVIVHCTSHDYVDAIVGKLLDQDASVVVVLDRMDHEFTVKSDDLRVVRNSVGYGCQRWRSYDVGLASCPKMGDSRFIFIDDQSIPQSNLVSSHDWLKCSTPLITIGRLGTKDTRWVDRRERDGIFGSMVNSSDMVKNYDCMVPSNFGMNGKAITILRRIMTRYFGTDRVFDPAFDGNDGGADRFLSYVAWAARVGMYFIPIGQNSVMRQSAVVNTNQQTLETEIGKLTKKLACDRLQPTMFEC